MIQHPTGRRANAHTRYQIRYVLMRGTEPLTSYETYREAIDAVDLCQRNGCAAGLSVVEEETRRKVLVRRGEAA